MVQYRDKEAPSQRLSIGGCRLFGWKVDAWAVAFALNTSLLPGRSQESVNVGFGLAGMSSNLSSTWAPALLLDFRKARILSFRVHSYLTRPLDCQRTRRSIGYNTAAYFSRRTPMKVSVHSIDTTAALNPSLLPPSWTRLPRKSDWERIEVPEGHLKVARRFIAGSFPRENCHVP